MLPLYFKSNKHTTADWKPLTEEEGKTAWVALCTSVVINHRVSGKHSPQGYVWHYRRVNCLLRQKGTIFAAWEHNNELIFNKRYILNREWVQSQTETLIDWLQIKKEQERCIARVAGVWKEREREFWARVLAFLSPFPFPFKRLPHRLRERGLGAREIREGRARKEEGGRLSGDCQ